MVNISPTRLRAGFTHATMPSLRNVKRIARPSVPLSAGWGLAARIAALWAGIPPPIPALPALPSGAAPTSPLRVGWVVAAPLTGRDDVISLLWGRLPARPT